jgi:hypothetical protein
MDCARTYAVWPLADCTPARNPKWFSHCCRNPHCRSKLPNPVDNPRAAFCLRGCYDSFYLKRCIVCERHKKRPQDRLCGRRLCRNEYRRAPEAFAHPWGEKPDAKTPQTSLPTATVIQPTRNAHSTQAFWRDKSGRGWAQGEAEIQRPGLESLVHYNRCQRAAALLPWERRLEQNDFSLNSSAFFGCACPVSQNRFPLL